MDSGEIHIPGFPERWHLFKDGFFRVFMIWCAAYPSALCIYRQHIAKVGISRISKHHSMLSTALQLGSVRLPSDVNLRFPSP